MYEIIVYGLSEIPFQIKRSKLSACYSMFKSKFLNKLNLVVLAIHSLKFSRGYFFKTFFLRKIKDRNSEGIILGN